MNNSRCFIEQLSVLKESSKEAVESTNCFSDFKKYMHVERRVQSELEQIIDRAGNSDKAQLILVCGSVGDGKSHILSYFKEHKKEVMEQFKLHNDATASYYIDKSSMDTLNEVLDGFSDENLKYSKDKVILAINLGTLNNFIESEYKERFTKLRRYVEEYKLLEDNLIQLDEQDGQFHHINFSDYHLYTLKNGKVKSDYIKAILNKIASLDVNNKFYQEYKTLCLDCENHSRCPIKANYEMLCEQSVVEELIQKIIEAVIKSKILISTRALFNFIYELIVDVTKIDSGSVTPRQCIGMLNEAQYVEALLPNLLYGHPDLSEIFNALSKLDPLNHRDEKIDEFIINYINDSQVYRRISERFPQIVKYVKFLEDVNFDEAAFSNVKGQLLKLYIRSYNLFGNKDLFEISDENYNKFIYYLYHWNKGSKKELKELYSIVKAGALGWNGDCNSDEMVISLGKNQSYYQIKQTIDIKRGPSKVIPVESDELYKFLSNLDLVFKSEQGDREFDVEIDITLFNLLNDVCNGYRPNKKDRNLYIKFNDFINKVEEVGSKDRFVLFKEKNRKNARSFKLEYDSEDEEFLFREI